MGLKIGLNLLFPIFLTTLLTGHTSFIFDSAITVGCGAGSDVGVGCRLTTNVAAGVNDRDPAVGEA